jgi:hypothetical protein
MEPPPARGVRGARGVRVARVVRGARVVSSFLRAAIAKVYTL